MISLVSHIWNESLLLPYFIKWHLPLFDRAVILDHGSTDGSQDIIRQLAPDWEVRPSRLPDFDSLANDQEVESVERELPGWRICLNVTEFICCPNLDGLVLDLERDKKQAIWTCAASVLDPDGLPPLELGNSPTLPQQRHHGRMVNRPGDTTPGRSRLLHRFSYEKSSTRLYWHGRHNTFAFPVKCDPRIGILWYAMSPWPECIPRKLQIQQRVPRSDLDFGRGNHHVQTEESLREWRNNEVAIGTVDLLEDPTFGPLLKPRLEGGW